MMMQHMILQIIERMQFQNTLWFQHLLFILISDLVCGKHIALAVSAHHFHFFIILVKGSWSMRTIISWNYNLLKRYRNDLA